MTAPADVRLARATVLNAVRRALRRGPAGGEALKEVEARLAAPPRGPAVARAALPPAERVALFCQWAEANGASVERVAAAEVPARVVAFLAGSNLPARAAIAPSPALDRYDWASQKMLVLRAGRGEASDQVAITGAFAAIAETGTLVMTSGPEHPVSLNLLPETHIVVLEEPAVLGGYEEVWARLRERYGKDRLPRTVSTITGPSRTGDIEQTIELGAHGPRRLHILVVAD